MKEFNCIGCPRGCLLRVEEENGEFTVTGNSCDNGRKFAISEMTEPKRTICSTVRTVFADVPVLPFKVIGAIKPKRINAIPKSIVLMSFIVYSPFQSKKQCTGPET